MIDEETGKAVDKDDKSRGYEISKGKYVVRQRAPMVQVQGRGVGFAADALSMQSAWTKYVQFFGVFGTSTFTFVLGPLLRRPRLSPKAKKMTPSTITAPTITPKIPMPLSFMSILRWLTLNRELWCSDASSG